MSIRMPLHSTVCISCAKGDVDICVRRPIWCGLNLLSPAPSVPVVGRSLQGSISFSEIKEYSVV
jgi:hypothetical protein